jgi:4-hydroxybenzoate polyprenyltransferase
MFNLLSKRLLGVLQLTRMALVFTAIADSFCSLILLANSHHGGSPHDPDQLLTPARYLSVAAVSIGLYGFGMSLNDIIDRRRDRQIAAHRPLPSGRVGVITAHVICGLLMFCALGGAAYYWKLSGDWRSFIYMVVAVALIWFYDVAGKYLVAFGLVTLGLIRFFHVLVPAPTIPVLWHPLLLFNHVVILSTIAYRWEQKRPTLSNVHLGIIAAALAMVDSIAIIVIGTLRGGGSGDVITALRSDESMMWRNGLLVPIGAVLAFILVGIYIRRRTPGLRDAGQKLMLYGLLWLTVYDACFIFAYVGWWEGLLMLLFFPAAWLSVQLMRWWSKIVSLSQKPTFKRVRA